MKLEWLNLIIKCNIVGYIGNIVELEWLNLIIKCNIVGYIGNIVELEWLNLTIKCIIVGYMGHLNIVPICKISLKTGEARCFFQCILVDKGIRVYSSTDVEMMFEWL